MPYSVTGLKTPCGLDLELVQITEYIVDVRVQGNWWSMRMMGNIEIEQERGDDLSLYGRTGELAMANYPLAPKCALDALAMQSGRWCVILRLLQREYGDAEFLLRVIERLKVTPRNGWNYPVIDTVLQSICSHPRLNDDYRVEGYIYGIENISDNVHQFVDWDSVADRMDYESGDGRLVRV